MQYIIVKCSTRTQKLATVYFHAPKYTFDPDQKWNYMDPEIVLFLINKTA